MFKTHADTVEFLTKSVQLMNDETLSSLRMIVELETQIREVDNKVKEKTMDEMLLEICRNPNGGKIQAIKKHRELTNRGLKESKDYVEAICAKAGLQLSNCPEADMMERENGVWFLGRRGIDEPWEVLYSVIYEDWRHSQWRYTGPYSTQTEAEKAIKLLAKSREYEKKYCNE